MINFIISLLIGIIIVFGNRRAIRRLKTNKHPGIFHQIIDNINLIFQNKNLIIQLSAIALTILIVITGLDAKIQLFFQKTDLLGWNIPFFFLMIGNFWHIAAAGILLIKGKSKKDYLLIGSGLAGMQAVFISFYINLIQKFITGRRGPLNPFKKEPFHLNFIKTKDPSDFRFDFWNHSFSDGRFFWPSGHTATIIAFVSALTAYYPEKKWIPWIGYPLVLLMGITLIDGDFHWFSDVVAGALIGHIIGWTTGKSFRKKYETV